MTTEKGGVPLTYTKELGDEICLKVSTAAKGLKRLCKENPHWPCHQTIHEWRIKVKEFGDQYAKAKQCQMDVLIEETLDIADDFSKDSIIKIDKNGNEIETCNSEFVNRSRLRIDTRKWLASKLAPKIYGDRLHVNTQDNNVEQNEIKDLRLLVNKCMEILN